LEFVSSTFFSRYWTDREKITIANGFFRLENRSSLFRRLGHFGILCVDRRPDRQAGVGHIVVDAHGKVLLRHLRLDLGTTRGSEIRDELTSGLA